MSASAAVVGATTASSASAAAVDNMDEQRMERIRRRNEELERKHREAEADRLAALRNNAMVVVNNRPANGDDDDEWPRAHRYDTLDDAAASAPVNDAKQLPAAVAAAAAAESSGPSAKGPGGRDYKKFADGEGPPPDPTFNFLADADRDVGNRRRNTDKTGGATTTTTGERNRNDWRSAKTDVAPTDSPMQRTRTGGLNSSFKKSSADEPRGQNNNNANGRPRAAGAPKFNKETSKWKDERERIDEARIGRQKSGDGKWRREWDNEKTAGVGGGGGGGEQLPTMLANRVDNMHITTVGGGRSLALTNANANNNVVEKRENVTVSLNKDGEVKSVKLQSARVIGTGRVGHRQPLPIYAPVSNAIDAAAVGASPAFNANYTQRAPTAAASVLQPHPYYHQQNNPMTVQPAPLLPLHHHHHAAPMQMPAPTPYFPPPVFTAMPPLAADLPPATRQFLESRPKLQDRLSRHRQPQTPQDVSSDSKDKQSQAA